MQLMLSFTFIYLLSAFTAQHMHILTPDHKMIHIPSPAIYTLIRFPYSVMARQSSISTDEQKMALYGIIFGIANQLILTGSFVLQFLPTFSCNAIEFPAGGRYRWMDFAMDSYNQMIPIFSILFMLCLELLIIFGAVPTCAIRNVEFRKKIGSGVLAFAVGLCLFLLIFLAILIAVFFKANG